MFPALQGNVYLVSGTPESTSNNREKYEAIVVGGEEVETWQNSWRQGLTREESEPQENCLKINRITLVGL